VLVFVRHPLQGAAEAFFAANAGGEEFGCFVRSGPEGTTSRFGTVDSNMARKAWEGRSMMKSLMLRSGSPSRTQRVACAWGSRSTSRVWRPRLARDVARFMAVVVLPTPPLLLVIANIMSGSLGKGNRRCRDRRSYHQQVVGIVWTDLDSTNTNIEEADFMYAILCNTKTP
jgi:hypothetical protein